MQGHHQADHLDTAHQGNEPDLPVACCCHHDAETGTRYDGHCSHHACHHEQDDHAHHHHGHHHGHTHHCGTCSCAHGHTEEGSSTSPLPAGISILRIPEMDCPVEENDIRSILAKIQGIRSLHFQLAKRELGIDADAETGQQCLSAIRHGGYQADIQIAGSPSDAQYDQETTWPMWLSLAIACILEIIEIFCTDISLYSFFGIGCKGLAVIAIGLAGYQTYRKGIAALFRLQLNINALMTVAVTGAFLIGEWSEAAMVMSLFAVSEWLERRAAVRADNAIKKLLDLTPDSAEVFSQGKWEQQAVKDIPVDALIRIRPGQRIPLDGIVQDGHSLVDQSAVTGESLPVSKQHGDQVFAGTVNQNSILQVKVTSSAADTVAARIVHAVEEAREAKAPFQQSIDRFASIYTPIVFVIALCIAVASPFLTGISWFESCYRAFAVLVIACPCALVISTPATLVSGLTAAVQKGILIKGGVFLEYARKIRLLALDKTGTITEGKPKLQHYRILTDQYAEADVLKWASILAGHSDHPVSKAIAMGIPQSDMPCDSFQELPGKGICATVEGHQLKLGSVGWITAGLPLDGNVEKHLAIDTAKGYTTTLLAIGTDILAVFAVADSIKPTSKNAVNLLNKLGIETVLLTGDNPETAKTIAHEACITEVRAQLLPTDKSEAVHTLRSRVGQQALVAMVGDGINDAPALATADIGIAMGQAGTDIAMEAADIVIMNDDLGNIPKLIQLSKDTFSILTQIIVLALGVKVLFIALALIGMASMWMAVFADIGTTLIVLFNGLRVLKK